MNRTCNSTHGGDGYIAGDRWDNGAIICGCCGVRIENPPPTGGYIDNNGVETPTWPEGIIGIPSDKTSSGLRHAEHQRLRKNPIWRFLNDLFSNGQF